MSAGEEIRENSSSFVFLLWFVLQLGNFLEEGRSRGSTSPKPTAKPHNKFNSRESSGDTGLDDSPPAQKLEQPKNGLKRDNPNVIIADSNHLLRLRNSSSPK